jgi:hypothetical protein
MVATKKKTTTAKRTVKAETSTASLELKLKKVKKIKKPSPAVASIISAAAAADEAASSSSSSVVVSGEAVTAAKRQPRAPRVEIDMEALEVKERLETQEIQPLTVSQLKKLCKTRKIVGYSGKRKEQIMGLLVPVAVV